MRLNTIAIRNFRLLRRFRVDLASNKTTTVLVGPNNSGKTSVMDALKLFMGERKRSFSIHDFAHSTRKEFASIQKRLASIEEDVDAVEFARRRFPRLRMELIFQYSDEAADLVVANALLMSLDVASDLIAVRIEYALDNAKALWSEFKSRPDQSVSLFDFLALDLNKYFKLRSYKISTDGKQAELLENNKILERLLKIDVIPAQRHLDDDDTAGAAKLSRLLHHHYDRYYKLEHNEGAKDLEEAIKASSEILTGKYVGVFGRLTDRLKTFGYPQGHASPDLLIKAEMTAERIYRDSTRIYYASEHVSLGGAVSKYELPEKYNGLGYKNLIFIVLQLETFRAELEALTVDKPRVHIIAVEEPEAHLHPQMQNVFIKEISKALASGTGVTAQVILSTHSSHMVSGSDFDPIRYFKRTGHNVTVRDLSKLPIDGDDGTVLNFLRRYVKSTHCELFFADKAIFVEGQVERLLLPLMIDLVAEIPEASTLPSQYISISEVGGAYAHKFRPLIDFLGVPTLIITDVDAVNDEGKKCRVIEGKATSNAALREWLPGKKVLSELLACDSAAKTDGNFQVAYQVEENGSCGRSFEEAFVYANVDWLTANHPKLSASGKLIEKSVGEGLNESAYALCERLPKVDFALDLVAVPGWKLPLYISDGLQWLAKQGHAA